MDSNIRKYCFRNKNGKLLNVRMGNGIFFNVPKGITYTLNI